MVVVERSVATFFHLPRTFNHQLVPPVFFRIGAAVVSLRLCFPPPSPIHNRCSYNWRLAPVQITEARLDFNLTLKFTWNGNFLLYDVQYSSIEKSNYYYYIMDGWKFRNTIRFKRIHRAMLIEDMTRRVRRTYMFVCFTMSERVPRTALNQW